MEAQLFEFERSSQADDTNVRELTEQIKNLHLHKRPSTASVNPASTKLEDHLEQIQPFVLQIVRDELATISQNLVLRCSENQEKVAEEVNAMLQPVLESTAQISKMCPPTNLLQAGSWPSCYFCDVFAFYMSVSHILSSIAIWRSTL